jgi:non-specific serine/threonine protein kinase
MYGKLGVNNKQRAILRAGELGLLETLLPAASLPPGPPKAAHNLPLPLTSFIGRKQDIQAVKHHLTSHRSGRLLTLTGAGGSGKTRLALHVSAKLLSAFPGGVWFIALAPLADPTRVPHSLLSTLGLNERADRSAIALLTDFLQPKQTLLILDNCEHLLHACAQLAEALLRACPTLHILATSREALGLPGERPYLVPTLTTPDPKRATLDALPHYEAVQLFVERAQTALPGFALTHANALAVAQICHQLDGIPLALELAAARVKTLRAEQIAARLKPGFRLLVGGARTALPRHQTLHALIDWSHDQLSAPERTLLRRLAVFVGGWTLEAAEAVGVGGEVEAEAVLELLTQLANKSLLIVKREPGHEARYRMLETIRQYARERLSEAGDEAQTRRHLDFFLLWAERIEPSVRGPQQIEWLDQIEAEHDNLRAALEWSLSRADSGEASLRLAGALGFFWNDRGYRSEGRAWLARALARPDASSAKAARAKALCVAGFLARPQGDVTTAKALLEESVRLWQALGAAGQNGLARALGTLSEAVRELGDPATARATAAESVALFREQADHWGLAYALSNLGMALREQEDFALARSAIQEGLTLWRDLEDDWGMRLATHRLGEVALRQGAYKEATHYFIETMALARKLSDQQETAWALHNLGIAALCLDERGQARAFIEEGFGLFRELGDRYGIARSLYLLGLLAQFEGDNARAKLCLIQVLALAREVSPLSLRADSLMGAAGVAAADGQGRRAARLLGAAEAQLAASASYWDAAERRYVERAAASALAQLGEAAFAEARAEGRAMTFEQAVESATDEVTDVADARIQSQRHN